MARQEKTPEPPPGPNASCDNHASLNCQPGPASASATRCSSRNRDIHSSWQGAVLAFRPLPDSRRHRGLAAARAHGEAAWALSSCPLRRDDAPCAESNPARVATVLRIGMLLVGEAFLIDDEGDEVFHAHI